MNAFQPKTIWLRAFLAIAVAGVLIPTMGPAPLSYVATPTFCLLCGEQGGADAIANVVLFVPLGIALAIQGWRVTTQLLVAASITFVIESSQSTLIPGRDASLGDLLFNTVGAALGIGLVTSFRLWIAPTDRQRRSLQVIGGLFASLVMLLTSVLSQPWLEAPQYRSQWTQRVSGTTYSGRLSSVSIGNQALPDGYVQGSNLVSDAVMTGAVMRVRGTAGTEPEDFASIYTIRAQRNQEIWLVAQDGYDLIFRYRPFATKLALRRPGHRLDGVMSRFAPGTELSLDFQRSEPGFDIHVQDEMYRVAFRIRDGWRFILPTFSVTWLREFSSYAWMACLFFPFGLWFTRSRASAIGVGVITVTLVTVLITQSVGPPGMTEFVGAALGFVMGLGLQKMAAKLELVQQSE